MTRWREASIGGFRWNRWSMEDGASNVYSKKLGDAGRRREVTGE
jgi:hypothetical protein